MTEPNLEVFDETSKAAYKGQRRSRRWSATELIDESLHPPPAVYRGNRAEAAEDSEAVAPVQDTVPITKVNNDAVVDDNDEVDHELYDRATTPPPPEQHFPLITETSALVPDSDSHVKHGTIEQLRFHLEQEQLQTTTRNSVENQATSSVTSTDANEAIHNTTHELSADSDLPFITVPSTTDLEQSTRSRQIQILVINPTSSQTLTSILLSHLSSTVPPNTTIHSFTPSYPAPTHLDSTTDIALSTSLCSRLILPQASRYDAFLVASYTDHPLVSALRDELRQPVIGLLDSALAATKLLGSRNMGVLTYSEREKSMIAETLRTKHGFTDKSMTVETLSYSVDVLVGKPREIVERKIGRLAKRLVAKEADSIVLADVRFLEWRDVVRQLVEEESGRASVVDGLGFGLQMLTGLVREGLGSPHWWLRRGKDQGRNVTKTSERPPTRS